jgi:hypothetical protein
MNNYKKVNLILLFATIGLSIVLGILGFTSIKKEIEETDKINAFFAEFENLNQYSVKDTIKPKVITYSQLNNFDENDNYLTNKKDISDRVTTNNTSASKRKVNISNRVTTNNASVTKKRIDVSNRVTTYSPSKKEKRKKRIDVSKIVTTYKPKKEIIKSKKVISTKSHKKRKSQNKKRKNKKNKKSIPQKTNKNKATNFKKATSSSTTTLKYAKKELNTATNINFIESAPVYPSCTEKITENDKKACLLTNVSKFVLNNFNNAIGKKAGLKKGFHEIRILFIIDEKGKSKTYKVLGKYSKSVKNEVKRIINNLPKMIPGKSNGKNVPVKYSVKVLFEIK